MGANPHRDGKRLSFHFVFHILLSARWINPPIPPFLYMQVILTAHVRSRSLVPNGLDEQSLRYCIKVLDGRDFIIPERSNPLGFVCSVTVGSQTLETKRSAGSAIEMGMSECFA